MAVEQPAMTWCRACNGSGDDLDGGSCVICSGSGEHPVDAAYGIVGDGWSLYYPEQVAAEDTVDHQAAEVRGEALAREALDRAAAVVGLPGPLYAGATLQVHRLTPAPADVAARRPDGDITSGRVWGCFCGVEVPSWELQDHLIGHS